MYQHLQEAKDPEDKEAMYAVVFESAPYSDTELRLVMSYLQKLVDQFLALEQWQNTPAAVESDMARAYRNKGLDRHFQEALELAKQKLEREPHRNGEYYQRAGALLWEEARYNTVWHRHPKDEHYLLELSENADLVWLSQKLRYLCLHSAYRTRFQSDRTLSLRKEVETILERPGFLENNTVSIWYFCLKMIEMPEAEEYFGRFKKEVLSQGRIFHRDELRDLHLFAVNYCIRRVNEGQTVFFHDIMDFYKDGLEKGHLLDNGVLSHVTYYNIVAAALHTRDYEWVEDFIPQFRNSLERSFRDSAYSFNLARLKFARKDFDAALKLLQHSNYHEPLVNMAAKSMAIKIYYALQEYEVLHAHLEAFVKYIRRKPGLGYHRQNYLLFARLTQRLIGLNWNNRAEVQALREKIAAEPVLTEKEWLLEQF